MKEQERDWNMIIAMAGAIFSLIAFAGFSIADVMGLEWGIEACRQIGDIVECLE